jgi:predicted RNA-binding Zn-ribbon protein involved in translation (DUF1610 family)
MSQIHGAKQTVDVVYFCPQCGSPSVDRKVTSILLGDAPRTPASCRACKWEGLDSDLIGTPLVHEFANAEEIIKSMMGDLRLVLSKAFAPSFLPFLKKWGFLEEPIQQKQAMRYLVAVAKACMDAVIAERVKIEEEKHRDHAS